MWRHQVVELPEVKPRVTEYQLCYGHCARCETWTQAELPQGVPSGAFGPRLTAVVALLTGRLRLTKRLVREFLSSVLGVEVALGSISKLERSMSAALQAPVEEAREYVREASSVNADETSWREKLKKAWLWVATTALVTVFSIHRERSGKAARQLLGEDFVGFVGSDRWSGYNWVDIHLRQVCWAHLRRDFQKWVDRGGAAKPLGQALLEQVWCSPKETPLPPFPEAPPLPAVMESDGVTEVSLAGVPHHYDAIAATEDGSAYLMARSQTEPYSAPSGPSTLWRLTPVSPEAERLEPPPAAGDWSRLATAPDDGSLWALGKSALAHREADGRWTVHTLPGDEGQLTGFLALPRGQAVVLRSFYDDQRLRLQLVLAGPGPALQVTEHVGGGEPMPLVPLPDGFLFLGSRVSPHAMSGDLAPALVPGFRFREGKRLEKDALLEQVRGLLPQQVWLRQGRVLMISGRRPSTTVSWAWVEVDARTGKVLKQQESSAQPRTIVGVPDVQSTPGRRQQELPEWLDYQGKVIEMPGRYTPTWLRLGNEVQEAASTAKGTWLQLKGNVLLFWDGARLSAWFHPRTREHGIQYAE